MQLQLASSDALARLCSQSKKLHDYEVEEAFDVYFEKQEHFNLSDFLQNYLRADEHFETGKLMQVRMLRTFSIGALSIFVRFFR